MRKHICFLGNAASIHVVRWVNFFADRDWTVDLITWHPPTEKTGLNLNGNVKIHRIYIPPHFIGKYGSLLEMTRLLRKIRPDIIHAHFLGTFGILAAQYRYISGFRPIIVSIYGAYSLENLSGMGVQQFFKNGYWKKFAIKHADCLHCDGENVRDLLLGLGANASNIITVYYGVDIKKFIPGHKDENVLKELNLRGSPVVISLRRMDSRGGVSYLIESIPLVLDVINDVKFIIAGSGSELNELKSLSESLGISDYIRFVGWIKSDDLPKYLNSSDVYVSTSLYDGGLAASTAEAMACGLPVVVTDFGDNKNWVQDGVNGFAVPMRDSRMLAEKIIYLLTDECRRKEIGLENRKLIENKNNYYKEMEKIENAYIKLIEQFG